MWVVRTKRGPFKTKREACEHASLLMREYPEIYEVSVTERPGEARRDLQPVRRQTG